MTNDRIVCPRCGANNFLGQPVCWSCQASLPPPEALYGGGVPSPHYQAAGAGPARWVIPAIVGVALLLIVGVFAAARVVQRAHPPAQAPADAALGALKSQEKELQTAPPPQISNPADLDPGSTEARAQAELQRLRKKINDGSMTPQPPSLLGPAPSGTHLGYP